VECADWQEVKSELRGQGCTNAQIEGALKQLEEADDAEIRVWGVRRTSSVGMSKDSCEYRAGGPKAPRASSDTMHTRN
jgi:hypothetical protein